MILCQLVKTIEEYNSSCSNEEFMLKLDLLEIALDEYRMAYG